MFKKPDSYKNINSSQVKVSIVKKIKKNNLKNNLKNNKKKII